MTEGKIILCMLVLCALQSASAAKTHVVGGDIGWTVPSSKTAYTTWAASETFKVGDTLEFKFQTGAHDVVQVKKAEYDACTASSPIGSAITTGPAKIVLKTEGENYFICSFGGHCSMGQMLAVNVTASSGNATPPPSTTPTPTLSPPPPSMGPTPPTKGTPTNSAPSFMIASLAVTLLPIIIAFCFGF